MPSHLAAGFTTSPTMTPNCTPTPSGRSTPLAHFKDVVSALHEHPVQECSHLLDFAYKFIHIIVVNVLIAISTQIHDTMRQFKTEQDSEAHTVRVVPSQSASPLTGTPRSSASQEVTSTSRMDCSPRP